MQERHWCCGSVRVNKVHNVNPSNIACLLPVTEKLAHKVLS